MQNNNFLGSKKFRMCNDKEYITDEGFANDVDGDLVMSEKMEKKLNAVGKAESEDVPLEVEMSMRVREDEKYDIVSTSKKIVDIIKKNVGNIDGEITAEEYIRKYEDYTGVIPSKELCELFSVVPEFIKMTEKLTEKY